MKEQEIRPRALLERYVALSNEDTEFCFQIDERDEIPCVACGADKQVLEFEKIGFSYARCQQCGSLFQTPRPLLEAFEQFYRESKSSRYWAEVFFPAVAEVRREKIFYPRVQQLADLLENHQFLVNQLVEVGAGYGIFLEEWKKKFPDTECIAVEPSRSLAEVCRSKEFRVIEALAEQVESLNIQSDLVVCFEVLEHVHDPLAFVQALEKMVRPGGYLLISTLSVDGFDLQILGEKSVQISPPHHINFFSVSGFEKLFQRAGLIDIEITTPGRLDVDIVRNQLQSNPDLLRDQPFLLSILEDEMRSDAFQVFLSENQLSSHAWVLGKKVDHSI